MNFGVLHNLLMPNMFGRIDRTENTWVAILEETDSSAKLKRIDICDVPNGSELIKIDGSQEPNTLFLDNNGQRKRCDYLLITTLNGKKTLLFMEMKSKKPDNTEVKQKFLTSQCLWDYIVSMLDRFHRYSGMPSSYTDIFFSYEKRFVRFQTKNLNKQGTRRTPPDDGRSPERVRVIPNPNRPSLKYLLR